MQVQGVLTSVVIPTPQILAQVRRRNPQRVGLVPRSALLLSLHPNPHTHHP